MEKYKRFKEELTDNNAVQEFLDKITTEGWEILYYNEREYGGMGMVVITAVCKKRQEIL